MLTDKRATYRPHMYPQAFQYFMLQQQSHWLPTEVKMSGDIKDYQEVLTEAEKQVVIKILRLFTTIECDAEDYWLGVAKWFGGHPEIAQMAAGNASMEAIHIWAYDYLSTSLNLPLSEYEAFLKDPAMLAKKQRLGEVLSKVETLEDKAVSLAVFSAFTEGVSLFSSFAALMSFSKAGLLKGVANITAYSIKDESLHAEAGCWLFRTLINENPSLMTEELKERILDAARIAVSLEDDYIDAVFSAGEISHISSKDLKAYIRFRANTKLTDLGLKKNWKNIDLEAVRNITSWFDILASGNEHADFFAIRSVSYSKGNTNWDLIDFSPIVYKK
jgi:ribonucleoside-diphosphate reductase beta chain